MILIVHHLPHRIWNLESGECLCSLQGHWVGTHCLHCCHSSLISVFWTSKVWRKCKLCQYKDSVPLGPALQFLSLFELFVAWDFVACRTITGDTACVHCASNKVSHEVLVTSLRITLWIKNYLASKFIVNSAHGKHQGKKNWICLCILLNVHSKHCKDSTATAWLSLVCYLYTRCLGMMRLMFAGTPIHVCMYVVTCPCRRRCGVCVSMARTCS